MRARAFRYNSFNKAETEGKTEGEIEGGEIEGERWKVGERDSRGCVRNGHIVTYCTCQLFSHLKQSHSMEVGQNLKVSFEFESGVSILI